MATLLVRLVLVVNTNLPIHMLQRCANFVPQENNLQHLQQSVQIALTESTNHPTLYLLSNVKHVQKQVLQLLALNQLNATNAALDVTKIKNHLPNTIVNSVQSVKNLLV